jgi:N-acetylneuraminic acid mutarotase
MMCLTCLMVLPGNATALASQPWQNEPSMSSNTAMGVAVTGPGDLIYNFGGWSALQSYTNHTVRYDTTTGAVTNLAPMPKAVANSVAVSNNGMILVAGGRIAGGAAVATLYQYDVQHNTWSTLASMPKGVYQAMGAMDSSGKLWVAGGYNSTDGAPTNIVQIYDPATNSWSTGTALPTATYKGVGFNADGNIYVAGGVDGGNQILSNVYSMAPNGSSWVAKTAMPIANSLMGVALGKDNQAYVMGGSPSASGNFDTALNSTYIYNPDSNAWSSGPALPDKVVSASAASTSDGTVWRIGGITASSLVSKNVSALTVMSINETVSPSTPIGTGQNLAVTVAVDAPFRSLSSFQGTAVLVDGTGSAYASQTYTSGTSTTVHIVMTVPQIAPPGTYRVSFVDTVMHDANGSSFATDLKNVSFPVISVASVQDQIAGLQASLTQARSDANTSAATISALQSQIAGLQTQLTSLQGNDTALKSSVDSKTDLSLGVLALVLAMIAFIAVVVLLVMIMRKNNGRLFR